MNKSFDPEHIKNLAAGFVVDDLTPEEAQEFRLLLDEHPELIAEVDDLQEVLRQVLDGFTEVEAPAHLLPKILEQAENSAIQFPVVKRNSPRATTLMPLRWTKIAGSVAALFMIVLGVDNYQLRQNLSVVTADNQHLRQDFAQAQLVKTMLQNDETRLFTFKGVNSKANSSGSIVINPEQQKAVMVFRNLPAPPAGYVYFLWTVIASEKLPCGEVNPYSWGNASYELPFTPKMYEEFSHPQFSGLIVTLETDANVSRPTGTVVMQSSHI
ncbi:anti-sigma factor domain-containing protein [Nostoc sp. UHCC 0251]|uniref:anti-sigma factor domain-containing protein n=1 Tax=Nostoc sp. UHCC 0251 TaxID=3110240 RepID=UPI002B20E668|nr:anti-sigma factor [Nostoc sp. UHCC 0251]MEA5623758.1 anti-sigma factor [Nostoc sp. UHCC 0251]